MPRPGRAAITSVSCAAAGTCSAGGYYQDGQHAFAVNETNGTWGTATQVAAALNTGRNAWITSVSCAAPGNCSAGGFYADINGGHAFVVNETNGTWGKATQVAANLSPRGGSAVNSVSCAAAGNCSAGGRYTDSSRHGQAFVVSKP